MLKTETDLNIIKYLEDFKNGKIKKGKGLGHDSIDKFFRYKQGQFNMIQGHDNVGKTYWRTWYYLALSKKYNIRWAIWSGENKAGQIVRDLIQFLSKKYIKDLSMDEIHHYRYQISEWFTFIDNSDTYKFESLLDTFKDLNVQGALIDPYTGLKRGYSHSDNYEFLNLSREWVNKTGISLDVCTHPVSASGRSNAVYPHGHVWEGHLRHPMKAEVEGGKPFGNRCDDFFTCHRLVSSEEFRYYTMIYVDKIKDTETGGEQSLKDTPIMFKWEKGLGFTVDNFNPIHDEPYKVIEGYQTKPLKPLQNNEFDVDFKTDKNEEIPF